MAILGMGRQPGQPRYNGAVHNLSITESVLGTTIPILFGTKRLHGKLLDYYGFNAKKQSAPTGKGVFGSKGDYWEYYATLVMALAQGPIGPLLNVWDYSGELENLSQVSSYTVPTGGGSYAPVTGNAAPIQADLGVTKAVVYSVPTNDYGGSPKTLAGVQNVPLNRVTGTPAAGEYTFDLATGTYTFGPEEAGTQVAVSYSSQFSLYYFEQTQPALIPANTPFQITPDNYPYFYQDLGVIFIDTDTPGVSVSGTPSLPGEYHEGAGIYSFFPGDAGRPIYIKYSYTSTDATVTASSVLSLTLMNGAQSQPPWSYTESANPSNALGYSGIAYLGGENMDLGQTAQTPPYNFEVMGLAIMPGQIDANLCDVLPLLLSNPLFGIGFPESALDVDGTWLTARDHWTAYGFFISDALEASGGLADKLKAYCDAGNTAPFLSGGKFKMVPYSEVSAVNNGATYTPPTEPVAVLTWDDILLPGSQQPGQELSDDFIAVDIKAAVDLYNYVQANWSDRENSYNNDLLSQQNDAAISLYGYRVESAQDWSFICLRTAAQWALSCRLNRGLYIDKTFKFTLSYIWDMLEPMDVVVLPTGIPVRITKIEENEQQELAVEAENFIYAASNASIYPSQGPSRYQPTQSSSAPGSTFPAFFQDTTTKNGSTFNILNIAAAGDSVNWGGCQVWLSIDGETYSLIGVINEGCAIGFLTTPLAAGLDPDLADTLAVDMSLSGYALSAATQKVADTFGTLAVLISADQSKLEFISYANATLSSPNRYNLSYLRRGVYGTQINSFGAGDNFVYVGSSAIFSYQFPSSFLGQEVWIKLASFNRTGQAIQPLSQCKAWPVIITGQGVGINEDFLPSTYSDSTGGSGSSATNQQLAYDKNFNTLASFDSGNSATPSSDIVVLYSGFDSTLPGGIIEGTAVLFVNYKNSQASTDNPNQCNVVFGVSFNGMGGPFTTFYQNPLPLVGSTPQGMNLPSGSASIAVPSGTPLANIVVAISCENVTGGQRGSVQVAEIWIDGTAVQVDSQSSTVLSTSYATSLTFNGSQYEYNSGQIRTKGGVHPGTLTDPIIAHNFGLSIPGGATILGVVVTTNWQGQNPATGLMKGMQLYYGGSPIGTPKNPGASNNTYASDVTQGSLSDTWGAALTPAIVNDATFGFGSQVLVQESGSTDRSFFNSFKIKVYYIP